MRSQSIRRAESDGSHDPVPTGLYYRQGSGRIYRILVRRSPVLQGPIDGNGLRTVDVGNSDNAAVFRLCSIEERFIVRAIVVVVASASRVLRAQADNRH